MQKEIIPIVLLHCNQPDVLVMCVEAIQSRTKWPYQLYVVDNASTHTGTDAALEVVEKTHHAVVIRNKRNNWIKGFNLALREATWPMSKYYVFSDADIIVPDMGPTCWLSYLVGEMESHCCIGKLGLALNHANLENNPALGKTLEIERRWRHGPHIGSNIVAPVDTTLAIYRPDLFVTEFCFRIGHASLIRPYYYTCRTGAGVEAVHLGWNYYPGANGQRPTRREILCKAWVLSKMGAYVAPEIVDEFCWRRRMLLRCVWSIARSIHGIKVYVLVLMYLVKQAPRDVNAVQASVR